MIILDLNETAVLLKLHPQTGLAIERPDKSLVFLFEPIKRSTSLFKSLNWPYENLTHF
jgi:hypothetical protein